MKPGIAAYFEALHPAIGRQVAEGGLPCLGIAVASEGAVLFERTYRCDRSPSVAGLPPLFRIGSQSKTLAAAALLRLCDRGLVSLGDPLRARLPELGLPPGSPLGRATLLELSRHQSPLATIEQPWLRGADGTYRTVPRRITEGQLLRRISARRAAARRRERDRFDYSDFGFCLLGLIVERVTGLSYGRFVRRDILRPAGLEGLVVPAFANRGPAAAGRVLTGHASRRDGVVETIRVTGLGALDPAQGALATPGGICRFYDRLFAGGIVSPRSTRRLRASSIAFGPPGGGFRYSPGVTHFPVTRGDRPSLCLGHVGMIGGFCGATLHDPVLRVTVSLLMNAMGTVVGGGRSSEADPDGFIRGTFRQLRRPDARRAVPSIWRSPGPRA